MPAPLGLSAIGQVNVPVKTMERAVAFYRGVLCLPSSSSLRFGLTTG